ncbi:bacterial Ig-like domain (group 1) [Clostridium tepidiprofundi DSM 19306]|uniref:Bacterial Ig-like domain (Group 1) n=1 Tax=Clostridium tepidiprofundi DSM 19306 TaxID=1121338 RepID=A0A151B468_9CLOT|nr:Ig-like domain-containing protein [Clostridium tepidiprofundi]KYH34447.1 bacterial Ig-like domain (group 1) [Clostridium tepidiprofundi DSM 19306]
MNKKKIMALLMALGIMTPSTVLAAPFTIVDRDGEVHKFEFSDFSNDDKVEEFTSALSNSDFAKVFIDLNDDGKAVTLEKAITRPSGEDFSDFERDNQDVDLDKVVKAEVKKITPVNLDRIKIEFTSKVADVKPEDFIADGLTFSDVRLAEDGLSAEVTVKGAKFKESKNITVKGIKDAEGNVVEEYTSTVKFGDVNEYYQIKIEFDCKDTNGDKIPDIKADGATNTQVTAIICDKEGNVVKDAEGIIRFDTTEGGMAQDERTIENGKASIQLTSKSSLTKDVIANVSAVVLNEYEFGGLRGHGQVQFLQPGGEAGPDNAVPMVNAESNDADRLYITLGQEKPNLSDAQLKEIKAQLEVRDGIRERELEVKEVKQFSSKVLEVILNTEASEENYLTDNAKHSVEIKDDVEGVVKKGSEEFTLTDTSKLHVLKAESKDQSTLVITFSEPVAWSTDDVLRSYDANNPANYLIDGDALQSTGRDNFELDGTRTKVTIHLKGKDRLGKTDNNIEISNVGDWAGVTDKRNRISTQVLRYDVNIDDTIPEVSVERQSPEQFLIKFTTPVTLNTDEKLSDVVSMRYGKKDKKTGLRETEYKSGAKFTALKGSKVVTDPKGELFDSILVELKTDWTKVEGVKAYWVDASTIQFNIDKDIFKTDLGNKTKEVCYDVDNGRDRTSPDIISLSQEKNKDGELLDTVEMVMNEPIQVNDLTDPITPNGVQEEENGTEKVQAGEIRFEKDGVVVPGEVESITEDDYTAIIKPVYENKDGGKFYGFAALREVAKEHKIDATGEWIVSITGFSDDYGNTMDTQEFKHEFVCPKEDVIAPTEKIEVDPEVMYAEYVNDDDYDYENGYDVIRVKFTEAMSNEGAVAVGNTANYVYNGTTLAELGSQVRKGIYGVTTDWDGITILLPKDRIGKDANFVLNVSSNLRSADGQKLVGEHELNLVDTDKNKDGTETSTYNAGILFKASKLNNNGYEAAITSGSAITLKDVDEVKVVDEVVVKLDTKESLLDDTSKYVVRINGEQISDFVIDKDEKTITITPDTTLDEQKFEAEQGDKVEVTVNGQTVLVKEY